MVTAEKIIEYVLYTPHNPNRAVLKSMLESYLKDNGGGGSGNLEDKIIILPSENGITEVSTLDPKPGEVVTITPIPNVGKVVSSLLVITVNGDEVEVIDNGDGTYSYTQPKESVIPVVEYGSETIDPDDIIIYDGGGVSGW